MTTTKLTLTVPAGLSEGEVEQLRQLFYDAFGEFITVRGPVTATYVQRRYKLAGKPYAQKVAEVEGRKALALRIQLAASNIVVQHTDDE